MHEPATALSTWESFYVIVGSSGGALIGLQFVVITLLESSRRLADSESVGAFGTPTVVHFGSALIVAAVMSAPWPSLFAPSIAVTICGLGGLVYCGIVIRRARRQTTYQPVFEDWLWYSIPGTRSRTSSSPRREVIAVRVTDRATAVWLPRRDV